MTYVFDASAGLKWVLVWVLVEADTPKARQLRDDLRNGIHEFIAPDAFALEVAHALAKAERRGIITPSEAASHLVSVLSEPLQMHASRPLLMRAFAIASNARIGVYDCLYVALAEREGCEFITAADRLIRALRPTFPFIISLASLP
jgi:predicted nucleic acid-binding protein